MKIAQTRASGSRKFSQGIMLHTRWLNAALASESECKAAFIKIFCLIAAELKLAFDGYELLIHRHLVFYFSFNASYTKRSKCECFL